MRDKKALRHHYLQLRLSLSESEWAQGSQRICDLFFIHTDLTFVKAIHIFLPLKKKSEPDTWLIIDRLKREFPHIKIAVPKIDSSTGTIRSYLFVGMNQLKQNQWGIDEPEFGEEIYPEEFDLIIVPLLAFDKSGHRVGYGKGYYDRFLSKCRPDAKRIGLSFFKPTDNIDAEEHDLQLTSVITTAEIFTF